MSVTSHLKDLLTKMGGTPKDGDSTSVLIDKIEDVYDGSGSGGGGSSDSSNKNVIVYLDDIVDVQTGDPASSGINLIFKLNKTIGEILDYYDNGLDVNFCFEQPKKWSHTASFNLMTTTGVLIVPHNNHSSFSDNSIEICENKILIVTKDKYDANLSDDVFLYVHRRDGIECYNVFIMKQPDEALDEATAKYQIMCVWTLLDSDGKQPGSSYATFYNLGFSANAVSEYPTCEYFVSQADYGDTQ